MDCYKVMIVNNITATVFIACHYPFPDPYNTIPANHVDANK